MAFPEAYEFYTSAMAAEAPRYENRLTLESVEWLDRRPVGGVDRASFRRPRS